MFTPLYALPIVAASRRAVPPRQPADGGRRQRCASSAIVVAQYSRRLAGRRRRLGGLPPADVAWVTVGINVFAFFAVAFLAGQLAENLRWADVAVEAASEKIADLEAFNRNVIDHLVSGLATMDAAGRLLTFNRAAAAITGWSRRRGRHGRAPTCCSCPRRSPPTWRDRQRDGRSHARRLHLPAPRRPRDRARRQRRAAAAPDGARGVIFTFQDVTDIKGLERTAQMRQRLAAVGEMAAGIAHEIRNPLASMSGAMQMLRGELPLRPSRRS